MSILHAFSIRCTPQRGTSSEQILRTFSGQGTFCDAKMPPKSLKLLAHQTGSQSEYRIQRVRMSNHVNTVIEYIGVILWLSNLIGEPIIFDYLKL
jgi:hypothetical protein